MAHNLKPFFSIIIPALNEARYLPRLLTDLTRQSFRDFEVIVVDGLSEDETVKKTELARPKLPSLTILSSPRRHVCTQRNLGAKSAKGNWLVFMDADNRLPPYFLLGLKYRLESAPADLATCYLQSDSPRPLDQSLAKAINYICELLKDTKQARVIESLVVSKRSSFRLLGGFDESTSFAEGNNLLCAAKEQKLTFLLYRDPVYTYSFRRLRTVGRLDMLKNGAILEILRLLKLPISDISKQLYPMTGGKQFSKRPHPASLTKLTKLLDALKQ